MIAILPKFIRRHSLLALFALLGVFMLSTLAPSSVFAQCAMCRTALSNSEEGRRWAQGIDSGIIFLLLAPFLVVAAIAFRIYQRQLATAFGRTAQKVVPASWLRKLAFVRAAKTT